MTGQASPPKKTLVMLLCALLLPKQVGIADFWTTTVFTESVPCFFNVFAPCLALICKTLWTHDGVADVESFSQIALCARQDAR